MLRLPDQCLLRFNGTIRERGLGQLSHQLGQLGSLEIRLSVGCRSTGWLMVQKTAPNASFLGLTLEVIRSSLPADRLRDNQQLASQASQQVAPDGSVGLVLSEIAAQLIDRDINTALDVSVHCSMLVALSAMPSKRYNSQSQLFLK